MSYEAVDRWDDNGPACAYCGRSIRLTSGPRWCGTCEPEQQAVNPLAVGHARSSPEAVKYMADSAAFDAALYAEMEVVPEEERETNDMPIIAKETGGNFKPAPAGTAMGICCDVVDLGQVKTSFPGKPDALKHMIRVVWQLAEVDPAIGKRPLVSQRYTLSLHEKANLRKDLQSWRGRTFTPAELQGFDVEKVVGVPCVLNIVHSADGQYANVAAIMPVLKGMAVPKVDGYVRVKDRPKDPTESPAGPDDDHDAHEQEPDGFTVTDEMVPF